ncbi:MAG: PAS domain S-box protein [Desulfobacula sp.]|jgi:PAS domain S-box-containing protein
MPRKPTYKELEPTESLRNRSETASKANIEAWMETIFKVAPIGIGVVKDRVLFEVNEFLCRMTGFHREELIGKSSRILYPSDEDYEFVGKEKYRQIREKGVGTVETRFISGNRGLLNIQLSSMPLDETDLSAGVTFTALDITERKQAEKALRESEERLKIAGKASYDLIYEWNVFNDELEWFGDIDGLLGYEKGEISRNIGAWLDLIHVEDRPLLETAVEFHRTKSESIHYEYRIKHKNGAYLYLHDHGLPLLDEKGRAYKWVGVCTDITNRKKTEIDLRESEEKFSKAFRTSPYAITITRPGDGKFIDVNDTFFIITGYTREETLINSSIGLNLWVNEADRDQVVSELRQGKRVIGRELMFKRKNGDIMTGLFSSQLMNFKTETFILSSINDITEQKRLESERKQKAAELEDTNTALNILLKKRDQDNQEMEKKIYANYDLVILPFLNKLRNSLSDNHQHQLLDILETGLKEILSPFAKKMSDPMIMLTPSEIRIASMIRQGMSNKEIAQTLNSSIRTIETHRANIRKKLDLTNKKLNLKSYFSNI